MALDAVMKRAKRRKDCEILRPSGRPDVRADLTLPEDLAAFYGRCGGLVFDDWEVELRVVEPRRFLPSDLVVLGEPSDNFLTRDCYVIAEENETGGGQRISIDLNPERFGRCYDTFWDRYANPGSMDIVASSFTEFIEQLLAFKPEDDDDEMVPFWLGDDFEASGDAYD